MLSAHLRSHSHHLQRILNGLASAELSEKLVTNTEPRPLFGLWGAGLGQVQGPVTLGTLPRCF